MTTPKQPDAHDDAAAHPEGPWREEEKQRGAGMPADDAGVAGQATNQGHPHDDRARTEGAAAAITRRGGTEGAADQPPPHPDTVVVGGIGVIRRDPA